MAKRKYVKENNLVKAINTDSLELQKPLVNEYYDINVHNSNMDKIDLGYKQNKNDISNINYELSKTENTKYTTENGIKEFSCKDGYVDNVVIEGETLVNLNTFNAKGYDGNRIWLYDFNSSLCTNNTQYTIFNTNDKIITIQYTLNGNWVDGAFVHLQPNTSQLVTVSNNYQFGGIFGAILHGWGNNDDSYAELKQSIIILGGDHTDKPISYFEGLKSVGQGDKIEVLTQGENIFDGLVELGSLSNGNPSTNTACVRSVNFTLFDSAKTLYQWNDKGYNLYYYWYDSNYKLLQEGGTPPTGAKFFKFRTLIGSNENDTNVKICISYNPISEYIPSQYDKKQISTTLRSLPNGVKDTIEKRGNKYYKIKRCGEVVLNGNEDWVKGATTSTTISYILNTNYGFKINGICISDKFIYEPNWNNGIEGVRLDQVGKLTIEINTTKLTTAQDLAGFKTWLTSNPVTVVYELATPIIEELPNFNPQTFSDKTTLLLNSGVVQGEASFEVTNSLGSELEVLKNKVSDLDDYAYQYDTERISLLNGFVETSSAREFAVTKFGKICVLNGQISNPSTFAIGTIACILPEKYRPSKLKTFTGMISNGAGIQNLIAFDLHSSGLFRIIDAENYVANESIKISCVWGIE